MDKTQRFEDVKGCPNLTIFFKSPEDMASFIFALEDGDIRAGEPVFVRNADEKFYNTMLYHIPGDIRDECKPIPVYKED